MNTRDGQRQLALFSSEEAEVAKIATKVPKKRLRILKSKDKEAVHFLGDYLTGPSNKESYILAKEIIAHLGRDFPLIMFQATSGVGKSYLLEVIFNEWRRNYPKKQFLSLGPSKKLDLEIKDLSDIDGIVFDDICKASLNSKFREKFFPVLEYMIKESKPLVCSSYEPHLDQLREEDRRFYNKLCSGLNKTIGRPDALVIGKYFDRKLGSIFKNKEDLQFLLYKPWTNHLEMISFCQRVFWYKKFNNKSFLDVTDLELLFSSGPVIKNGPEFLVKKIAKKYQKSVEEILSPSRKRDLVKPRHELIKALHKEMDLTVIEIARFLKRNHSSIIYALKK
ncbi:MAG: helix-turn-helix domain-containing protein [Bacteriovoracaceae bacterium]